MRTPTRSRVVAAVVLVLGLLGAMVWRRDRPLPTPSVASRPPEDTRAEPTASPLPSSTAAEATRSITATAQAPAAPPEAGPPLDEPALMSRLRRLQDGDPAGAVALAREGNQRFGRDADAAERTSILIHALAALDRPSEARGEAEDMVNGYPDSTWVREVEHFTGAHRHRNVRITEDGGVVFQ